MIETKNRLTIRQEWVGKNVVMRFPVDDVIVEMPHDTLVELVRMTAPYLETPSWQVDGWYSTAHPNKMLRTALRHWAKNLDDPVDSIPHR